MSKTQNYYTNLVAKPREIIVSRSLLVENIRSPSSSSPDSIKLKGSRHERSRVVFMGSLEGSCHGKVEGSLYGEPRG
jgi:hypothetical protein